MEDEDYNKLKFKSGLEIHQQLDTKKLFCNCPSVLRSDEPDFSVERKLHAVAGEKGEVDVAAAYQAGLERTFIYQGHKENSCLIELDEEPPHEINKDALKIALQVALLLNCKIQSITQIMRKMVIDGSNTSGFQRTVLIACDGYLETSQGKVRIDTLCLEEDSARKVNTPLGVPRDISLEMSTKGNDDKIYYALDRLGIPLVEIATAPDIKNAEQAKEAALKMGDVLRSCKVKRGLGTIRQDVNISIRGENRIEMKGVQDMKMFLKVVENETLRQKELSDNKKPTVSEVRNALADGTSEFLRPMPGADRMYPETDLPLLKISRDFINECKKDLPKLRSEVQEELKKKGLNEDMIKLLFKLNRVEEFKNLLDVIDKPQLVAKLILLYPKEIASKVGKSFEEVDKKLIEFYGDVLIALNKKKISEGDIKDILVKLVNGESFESAIKIEKKDLGEIEEKILKIIKSKPGLNPNAYMGLVMKEFKGQVNGMEVMNVIQKFIH
jgi:Glu-tRNA(Gln) amidotransferase subunit E-like FAD-binding protein